MSFGIFDYLIKPLLLIKAEKIESLCKPYLKGKVLDVGAGRCYISKRLKNIGLKVTCLDVNDLGRAGMKVVTYNGRDFPFKNDQFDSALIAYVLHHCEDPLRVLNEAIRACKGNIVIFEDTKPSPITNAMDFLSNKLRNVDTPFKFRARSEWMKVFKKLNLKVIDVQHNVEKEWFYPFVEHTIFVVRKN